MKNADLAEIRALLQASVASERRRQPRPMFGSLRLLLGAARPRPDLKAQVQAPVPRRAGLGGAPSQEAEVLELTEAAPHAPDFDTPPATARRNAFGQRQDTAASPRPRLQLTAPPAPEADAEDIGPLIEAIRARRASQAVETPYLPGDLTDHAGADAERLYAASGLFEPRPAPTPGEVETDPERELLRHLERVFLAERAALSVAAAA